MPRFNAEAKPKKVAFRTHSSRLAMMKPGPVTIFVPAADREAVAAMNRDDQVVALTPEKLAEVYE